VAEVQTKCKHAPHHSTTSANRVKAESSAIEPNCPTKRHSTTPPKWAHNPKVAGSNPAPATRKNPAQAGFFCGQKHGTALAVVLGQALGQALAGFENRERRASDDQSGSSAGEVKRQRGRWRRSSKSMLSSPEPKEPGEDQTLHETGGRPTMARGDGFGSPRRLLRAGPV